MSILNFDREELKKDIAELNSPAGKKKWEKILQQKRMETKKPELVIVSVIGIVQKVVAENRIQENYNDFVDTVTGYTQQTTIEIKSRSPVEKIIFEGCCPAIEKGDAIRGYVFAGEKDWFWEEKEQLFTLRKLEKCENAIRIDKFKEGRVVRTDYSIDTKYQHLLKED